MLMIIIERIREHDTKESRKELLEELYMLLM